MSVVPLEGGPPSCARCWARAWGLGQVLAEARRINGITGDNTRDGPEASSDLQVLVPEDPERGLFSLLPVLRLSPGRRASSRSPELLQSTVASCCLCAQGKGHLPHPDLVPALLSGSE